MNPKVSPWHSLKTRATIFTLAIFVLGIGALSFYVSRSLQADMEQLLSEQQFSVATSVAKDVSDNLAQRMQGLETVAKAMDADLMGRPAAVQSLLVNRPLLQLLFNGGVWVSGRDGTVIAAAPLSAQPLGVNYMDMDFIATALNKGEAAIGRPVMGRQLKAPVFAMTVPVRDTQGKVIGAIVGVTNLGKPNFLDEFIQNVYGKTGGYVLIAARDRLVVTATDKSRVMESLPAEGVNAWVDRFANGYEGSALAPNPRGVETLVSGKGIAAAGWYLLATLPAEEAFAPLRDRRHRLIWATLLLTLLTGALTWLVLKRQLTPLAQTSAAMVALADSTQIPQPLVTTQQDEIGHLVAGFNRILQTWTEREAALQRSEQSLAITLNSMGDGVISTDTTGRITGMNPAAEALTGWPLAQARGRLLAEVFHIVSAQTRQSALDPVQRVLAQGEVVGMANHTTLLARDGRELQIADSAAPIRNASSEMVGVVLVFSDVSEKYRAEAALLASEERWKFAIEGAGDGLWDWNIQTGQAFYSPRYKSMLGFAEDEIGDSADEWTQRIHPQDAPGVYAALQPYLDGKPGTATVEFRMLCKDGSWQWTLGRGMVVQRDSQGKATRMIGTNSDITGRKLSEAALRDSESRFRAVVDVMPDGIVLHRSGKLLYVNPAAVAMFGASTEQELLDKSILQLIHPDFYQVVLERARRATEQGVVAPTMEQRYVKLDGTVFDAEVQGLPITLAGQPAVLATLRDITERRQAQAKLLLAASVFDHAREGITITDVHGTIVDINEAFTRITGYSREDAIGRNPRMLSSGRHDEAFYESMWHALNVQGHWGGEIWNRRKDGEIYAELLNISAVRDARGDTQQYVALFSDITAIKEHQRQLEHIAHFDALTSLPNRLLLADRLQQAMAQAQRRGQQVAVAYLDLDGFKNVNDRYGHDVGDQLLIHLAAAMKDSLREGDTLARLGGDEFVAVLIDLDSVESCVPMLTRLLDSVAVPVQLGAVLLQCSVSVGVTFYPQAHDMESDQLLRQADQAMYQAKLAGKNRYHVFDAAMDSSVRVHHESLERIRLALARGEFVLHYQPKVNMRTGQIMGAEALIRWQHPERGLLAPAVFLPVIEDHPLAVDVGEWVIATALGQMQVWHATGLDLPVSVNIGARQLQQDDFVLRLQAILARHPEVNPASLELEVLETSALADMEQVSQVIEACHQMGVNFALDDFGTGYSSLTYLKRLRVALLKIDQSFVRDMLDDPDDMAILQGVIGLAAAFKREVIAEGVETVEHGLLSAGR